MKLIKWAKNIKPKFPNILENFFGKNIDDQAAAEEEIAIVPAVNISEKGESFEVAVAVPGIDKKDINIEVDNNCLIISSEKQYDKEEEDGYWMRREYGYASFLRMFQLPERADPEKIEASIKNGILKITVGKLKDHGQKVKQIAVH